MADLRADAATQRQELERKKVAIRINNEEYLRKHPELRQLLSAFVCALVENRPEDVVAFASLWFTRPGLASSIGLKGWERDDKAEEAWQDGAIPADGDHDCDAAAAHPPSGATGESTAALEKQLAALFREADRDGSGSLDIAEFKAVMKTATLGLRPIEIQRLLAEVDEDDDGQVSYAEFVPLALDVVQALRTRDKVRTQERALDAAAEAAASTLVNGMPKEVLLELARQAFEQYDVDDSGRLSRQELRAVLRDTRLGLNSKQVRLVMAELGIAGTKDIGFEEFAPIMTEVLIERFKHELREFVFDDLEALVADMFRRADVEGTGALYRSRVVEVLLAQDLVLLSRMQATALAAHAQLEEDGTIFLAKFVPVCAGMLRAIASPAAVTERAVLLHRADFSPVELMSGHDRATVEENLREAFAQNDADKSGTLDRNEFELCLRSASLDLAPHEIYALMDIVDVDRSGQVDIREFATCAYDHLLHIKREKKILDAQRTW